MSTTIAGPGRRVRAVLFDVDGTLVDSIPFLVDCFRGSVREVLGMAIEADVVLPLVGRSLADMYAHVHPEIDEDAISRCVTAYRSIYLPEAHVRSPLFEDAAPVVEGLKRRGLSLGIVSGKNLVGIRRVLEHTGLLAHFDAVVGSDHGCPGKPAPDGALAAAALLEVEPAEALVVGDSLLDIAMGAGAGMLTCGVTTGTATREELEREADIVVDRLGEISALFDAWPTGASARRG